MEEKKYLTTDELEAARLEAVGLGADHLRLSKLYNKLAIILFLIIFVIGFIAGGMGQISGETNVPIVIIVVVLLVPLFILYSKSGKHKAKYMDILNPFNAMYKTQFLPGILAGNFDEVYAYEPENGISKEVAIESGIFGKFDYITTNDYLRARHGDMKFEFCDMKLEKVESYRDMDGNTSFRTETCFFGYFIIAEFDHFVDTPVYIYPNSGTGTVTTESAEFNEIFQVDCENPTDALRILTPQMMSHILKIKEYCDGSIRMAFQDDKVFFRSGSSGDLLEVAYNIEIPIPEARKQIDKDIEFIKGVLDLLAMRNLKSKATQRVRTDKEFASHSAYQNRMRNG
jgi:hypothetical protein